MDSLKNALKPYFNLKKNLAIFKKRLNTPKIIDNYFKNNPVIKLHLGCGGRIFNNWLNCDINLQSDCYVDLIKKLPFKDNSADFIYSEHVVEHFDYPQAKQLLKECYRILKPNGVIRTAIPDLDFFIKGILEERTDEKYKRFVKWHQGFYQEISECPANMNTMINFICGRCGHKYVYRDKTFIELLSSIGFKNNIRKEAGKSDYQELTNLESNPMNRKGLMGEHQQQATEIWLMYTMAIEGKK